MNEFFLLNFVLWIKWKHDGNKIFTPSIVWKPWNRGWKVEQEVLTTTITTTHFCNHRDALRNSCTNKLLALFAVVSLITRNKGNRRIFSSTPRKHTHTLGFTFSQRAPAAETQCVCLNTCTCERASFGPDTLSQMFWEVSPQTCAGVLQGH